MRKIFALLNPASGSMDYDAATEALHRYSGQAGCELEIHATQPGDSLADLARDAIARGCTRVIAGGGDGTVTLAAKALISNNCELAILPCGTANLLAKAVELPLELEPAVEIAVLGDRYRDIDAMQVDEEILLVHISIGNYSYIAEKTSASAKQKFGRLAYLYSTLREISQARRWRFEIQVDDKTYSQRSAFVLITNVSAIGPLNWRWNENSRIDDGKIEVCVVDATTTTEYFRYLVHVLRRQPKAFEGLTRYEAHKNVKISCTSRSRARVPVAADGDVIGHSSVAIKLLPGALRLVCPIDSGRNE